MGNDLLADLIVALHLAYVIFVIAGLVLTLVGCLLGWQWIRNRAFRLTHLICTEIVPVEAMLGVVCPLTSLENALRQTTHPWDEEMSFVGRLLRELLYYDVPPWALTLGYLIFGALVFVVWYVIPPRKRRTGRRRAGLR